MKTFAFQIFKPALLIAFVLTIAACRTNIPEGEFLVNTDSKGVILDGHDPVAFFTKGSPVKGKPNLTHHYNGATYWFSSDETRQMFVENPEKYAPQYGAYCGYAVSQGHLAEINVNYFDIIDGKLILQHNQRAYDAWHKDAQSLEKAEKYWPQILSHNGKPLIPDEEKHFLVNTNKDGFIAEGYDVVAYQSQGKPVKGQEKIVKLYKGALYLFSSEENKQLFGSDPEKYAPQFGGFCAYAVSRNKLRPIDPEIFQVVDGRLMLQHSTKALNLFSEDLDNNVRLADQNWPGLMDKKAGKTVAYDAPAK